MLAKMHDKRMKVFKAIGYLQTPLEGSMGRTLTGESATYPQPGLNESATDLP
jgi:hypothetical protein